MGPKSTHPSTGATSRGRPRRTRASRIVPGAGRGRGGSARRRRGGGTPRFRAAPRPARACRPCATNTARWSGEETSPILRTAGGLGASAATPRAACGQVSLADEGEDASPTGTTTGPGPALRCSGSAERTSLPRGRQRGRGGGRWWRRQRARRAVGPPGVLATRGPCAAPELWID